MAINLCFCQTFDSAVRVLTLRDYDYLDFRNESFDKDYVEFLSRMDSVTEKLQHKLENTYNGVWDTPHAFQYLPRFEVHKTIDQSFVPVCNCSSILLQI